MTDKELIENPQWITSGKPSSEDIMCVIRADDDWEIAYWVEGAGAWDSAYLGWINDHLVKGWVPLPEINS